MPCNKPNHILLQECGKKLTKEGNTPFTRGQLMDCVHGKHPDKKKGSLNPMIQGMTVNLKGGAPGGRGKNVFHSVGYGLFELYDPKKHGSVSDIASVAQTDEEVIEPSIDKRIEEFPPSVKPEATEGEIRDLLMGILYHRIGRERSWQGSNKTASFDLRDEFKGYRCFAERPLSYALPGIKIGHVFDILISNEEKGKHVGIEIKHRSAVTDQFKCRSYDMIHIKKSYGGSLLGIMVYVKSTTGISVKRAASICYSFDHFFGISSESRHTPTAWNELIWVIEKFLTL